MQYIKSLLIKLGLESLPPEAAVGIVAGLAVLIIIGLIFMLKRSGGETIDPPSKSEEPKKLGDGLKKTRVGLLDKLGSILSPGKKISADLYEQLEEALVLADLGPETSEKLLEKVKDKARRNQLTDATEIRRLVREALVELLSGAEQPFDYHNPGGLYTIMVVGVNGAGKTTTIGKLAAGLGAEGREVVIGAGDTFRAAAIDQLQVWADRSGARIVRTAEGADPSGVIFDAVKSAASRGADVVICDTAGRLHTQKNLMEELKKIKRVMGKATDGAPHEILLVIDGGSGQNAIAQARQFHEALGITGIVITKLDGTSKGGMIAPIVDLIGAPVRYIGIGEAVGDLRKFSATDFAGALFDEQ